MANFKDIHGNPLSLSASDILIPSLNVSLAEAINQKLLPVPDNVTEQVEGLESKVANAVGTISSVTVDVETDDTGTTHAEGEYHDGVLAITLYNVKGNKGDTLTFDDLTDEQKAELKGEKMTFSDLTEDDKNELRGAKGDDGKSAYNLAVENGYVGTEAEWLASLHGAQGDPGEDGHVNVVNNLNGNSTTDAPSVHAVNQALQNTNIEDYEELITIQDTRVVSSSTVEVSYIQAVPYVGITLNFQLPSNIKCKVLFNETSNLIKQSSWLTSGSSLKIDYQLFRLQYATIDGTSLATNYISQCVNDKQIRITYKLRDLPIERRNYDCEKYVRSAMWLFDYQDSTELATASMKNMPVLVHTSDLHGDAYRCRNFMRYADYIDADAAIITGDSVCKLSGDGCGYLSDIVAQYNTKMYHCIGNHEAYEVADVDKNNAYLYNNFISKLVTQGGYKMDANTPCNMPYYYADLPTKKIRIIAINQYDKVCYFGQNLGGRLGQDQIDWLCATLQSTPTDYGIVILMHANEDTIVPTEDLASFYQTYKYTDEEDDYYCANGLYVNSIRPIKKIVDAYISKSVINLSYNENTQRGNTGELVSIQADFSEAEGEFICYMSGHRHRDAIGYIKDTTNKQLMLNVTTGSAMYGHGNSNWFANESDLPRGDSGSTQDSFNLYGIDRKRGEVRVARIGSNVNFMGKERKFLIAKYKD